MTLPAECRQRDDEPRRAHAAMLDYCRMGPGRSLASLCERYQSGAKTGPEKPPTTRLNTLKEWSAKYAWQMRCAAYDAVVEAEKEAKIAARRAKAMEEGLALDYERVHLLKRLARTLAGEVFVEDRRWLADVKQIGAGEFAERVDIVRFNSALVNELRGVLDDLAKETGGRKHKLVSEVSGPDGGPIQHENVGIELPIERASALVTALFERVRARAPGEPPSE
jgi:hypothetical protein